MKPSSHPLLLTAVVAVLSCAVLRADPPKIVESPTAATAGKATIAITDSNKAQTIEADGKDVAVEGNHNKITLTGACHALSSASAMTRCPAGLGWMRSGMIFCARTASSALAC